MCLAAETCGHLDFDVRSDMWWRHEGFHCGDAPASHVTFAQIFWKVRARCAPMQPLEVRRSCCTAATLDVHQGPGLSLSWNSRWVNPVLGTACCFCCDVCGQVRPWEGGGTM